MGLSLLDRFLAKVEKSENGCWNWVGAKFLSGYGLYRTPDKVAHRAHRLSKELHGQPLSAGEVGRHSCDNKLCVRPDHILAGSQGQNMKEAQERGLIRKGESHPKSKLTAVQVKEIRSRPATRVILLSQEFGVSRRAIQSILNNTNWKGV